MRRIQLGQSTPSTAVITSGLKEGELVISEGLQRARPGEVVSPGLATPAPQVTPRGASEPAEPSSNPASGPAAPQKSPSNGSETKQ